MLAGQQTVLCLCTTDKLLCSHFRSRESAQDCSEKRNQSCQHSLAALRLLHAPVASNYARATLILQMCRFAKAVTGDRGCHCVVTHLSSGCFSTHVCVAEGNEVDFSAQHCVWGKHGRATKEMQAFPRCLQHFRGPQKRLNKAS